MRQLMEENLKAGRNHEGHYAVVKKEFVSKHFSKAKGFSGEVALGTSIQGLD